MDPIRLALAFALLTSPPGTFKPSQVAGLHANCAETVRHLAIHWEILDPHETHMLATSKDFDADLKVLQERYREFATAPLVHESYRLPQRALVEDMLAFNRSLQKELKERIELDRLHAPDLQIALKETEHLFRVWDAVREARCEYYYVTARRQALQMLRTLIGPEAFYAGTLPTHVPLWFISSEN